MKNIKNNDHYETTDLAFASFLAASGRAKLLDIRDGGQFKKTFVFSPPPPQEVILGFYNGSLKVSAIRLIESYQSLKSATYMVKSNGRKKP